MNGQLSGRTTDLQRLCAVVDKAHLSGSDETLPASMLEAIRELVPCNAITYQVMDPARELSLGGLQVGDHPPCLEPDEERLKAFFWPMFWSTASCNYPQQTSDFTRVLRGTDFQAPKSNGEYHRLIGMRYKMLIPLPPDRGIDHRILLWRCDGRDFSYREQMLLTLLRPHLAEIVTARRNTLSRALLTDRQNELLVLVADGSTNRQIARRLGLSEGTVRSHLENIFERLGVDSRTAAATYADRGPLRRDLVASSTRRTSRAVRPGY